MADIYIGSASHLRAIVEKRNLILDKPIPDDVETPSVYRKSVLRVDGNNATVLPDIVFKEQVQGRIARTDAKIIHNLNP